MPDQPIAVLEFDRELVTPDGRRAGSWRAWVAADKLKQGQAPPGARILAITDDREEVRRLMFEGECEFTQRALPHLVWHVAAGGHPVDFHPKVHEHLRICEVCRAEYNLLRDRNR
jgi:hypothetical protein